MAKRYYKIEEKIFIKPLKIAGVVKELDLEKKDVTVEYYTKEDNMIHLNTYKLWEIDKYNKKDVLLFAKIKPNAIIPSKRHEDGCYDVYPCFDENMIVIQPHKVIIVPTGIASCFSSKYRLNFKHERSSSGLKGIEILAGLIDSGYRNEIKLEILNTNDIPLAITKEVTEIEVTEDYILYPYSKAIAQGALEFVPDVIVKEIPYENLIEIPSERGMGGFGSTGK